MTDPTIKSTSLTDNLLDSTKETLAIKIPRLPGTKQFPVRAIKEHSLAGIVVNNASCVDLCFEGTTDGPRTVTTDNGVLHEEKVENVLRYGTSRGWNHDRIILACTNIGGNLWVLAKHAIPNDLLKMTNVSLITDGVAKEFLFIPRTQELKSDVFYRIVPITPLYVVVLDTRTIIEEIYIKSNRLGIRCDLL